MLSKGLRHSLALSGSIAFFSPPAASAPYKVYCNGQFTATPITSEFAEARPGCASCAPNRFHAGVDITGQCSVGAEVRPISSGTAITVGLPSCESPSVCIRVVSAAGDAFDYEHVVPTISSGPVSTSTIIGHIQDLGATTHLHLNDIASVGGIPNTEARVNPQYPFRLIFTDPDRPDFVNFTLGSITDKVILIQSGTEENPTPFQRVGGRYYVRGGVDILANARNGTSRKGVYRMGSDAFPIALTDGQTVDSETTLSFSFVNDMAASTADVRAVYYRRQTNADTFIPTNIFLGGQRQQSANARWATDSISPGARNVCVTIQDHPPQFTETPTVHTSSYCVTAVVDNTAIDEYGAFDLAGTSIGPATSSTTLVLKATDSVSGVDTLTLTKTAGGAPAYTETSTNPAVTSYYSATFPLVGGSLTTGTYTAQFCDLSRNCTSGAFTIDTTALSAPVVRNVGGVIMGGTVVSSNNIVIDASKTASGICPLNISGPDLFSSSSPATAAEVKKFGPFALVKQGTYTVTAQDCAGSVATSSFYFSTATVNTLRICAVHPIHGTSCGIPNPTFGDPDAATILDSVARIVSDSADPCVYDLRVEGQQITCLGGGSYTSTFTSDLSRSRYFSVTNISTFSTVSGVTITASVKANFGSQNDYPAVSSFGPGLGSGGVITGTVTIAEVGQNFSVATTSVTFVSKLRDLVLSITSWTAAHLGQAYKQGLFPLGGLRNVLSSDFSLTSQGTMTFTNTDPGGLPAVSTATLKLYSWTGSSWTLAGISQIGSATSGGLITSSATLSQSGFYSMLFSVTDASAPTTSPSIQGSSYAFAGTSFVSTYSYLVLSSTDPTVNNFSSGLATTYYRIDGLPGDAYSAYSSSLSFLPGTHWVDYYAVDWAGNNEAVQRATITVTAGSVTRLSSDLQVDGNLLVGFLGSGAKAEAVARAEYDYALMVSSVDGRAMLAVDNANFASIGTAPASGRLTLAGVTQDTALALRSGNSTAAVTGAQLAFGFDGSGDLRHRLYTQHGSAANWNKLVFSLWTPASGSSSTLGNLPVLSLEGSTITAVNALAHVMPAGVADKELVVSNGSAMGEGDVLRWDRWVPSVAILKKDIERLGRADEERAWADIAAMKPVIYRRKAAGPDSPFERGYIFEETPVSIRDGPGAASVDERLVNAELALKAAMRRIDELKARIKKVKEALK